MGEGGACERAIQAAADPQQKTILKNLRYLWIALANELSDER